LVNRTSHYSGFHKLSAKTRIEIIREFRGLTKDDLRLLLDDFASRDDLEVYANSWGENVIGKFAYFPLRIAPNFLIDGKEYFVPMAIEESSVVAAASYAARLAREGGGFTAEYMGSIMYGQIQLINVHNPTATMKELSEEKVRLLALANDQDQKLVSVGGGARDLEFRPPIHTENGSMVICHLVVDVQDILGANAVNTMVEAISPAIEEITGHKTNLRIISNLADRRLTKSRARFPVHKLAREGYSGDEVAERILSAYAFASNDPYRATTHNKGIMNGIDAVLLATGQDFRAVEAGAHAYASRSGRYTSLTMCKRDGDYLVVEIELPMAVGVVGGVKDPLPDLSKKILGVDSAD
jgi:hydroxymethylglutaryl-CoA reductase